MSQVIARPNPRVPNSKRSTCLSSTMTHPRIIRPRSYRKSHFQWTTRSSTTTSSRRLIIPSSPMKSSKSYSCCPYRPESVKSAAPLCATSRAGTSSTRSISASFRIQTRTSSSARRRPTTPRQTTRSAWTPQNSRRAMMACWEKSGPTS